MSWIHLPFTLGQDQTLDPKIAATMERVAPQGVIRVAQDCRIDKEGRIVKRHGYLSFSRTTWLNGTIDSPLHGIWSREAERVAIGGDRLYSYSDQGWRDWGLLSSVGVPERREAIYNKVASMITPSVAVIGNLVAVVGDSTAAGSVPAINGIVFDASDWSVRDQAGIVGPLPIFAPQIVAVGVFFVCVWMLLDPSDIASNNTLYFSVYDTSAAVNAHWSPPAVLAFPGMRSFDICSYSATHYLVVTGSNLYSATPLGGIATTTAFTSLGAARGQIAVCGAPGEYASIAWFDSLAKTLRVRSWAGSGGNPFAGASPGNIAIATDNTFSIGPTLTRKNATTHTVAISTNPRGGSSTGIVAEKTTWTEFTPSTGVLGLETVRPGFQLASKSYYLDDRIFTWGENFSKFERSYFLEAHTTPADGTIQTTFARNEAPEVTSRTGAATDVYAPPPSMVPITLDGQLSLLCALPFISIGSVARPDPITAIDIAQVPIGGVERYQSVEGGGCLYLAGGLLQMFDSQLAYELGFLNGPNIRSVVGTALAGGLTASGVYEYVIVREWRDAQGQQHISQVSDPVRVTLGPTETRAIVTYDQNFQNNRTPRWVSGGAPGYLFRVVTHIYRTLNGGTVFYRVTGDEGAGIGDPTEGSTPALFTYSDAAADTAIAGANGSNIVLYTQGQRGGLSGPLQHDPPPPCRYIWAGKDRVIIGGLEHPDQVRWSKTFFDGEPLEFSEDLAFRKRVPGRVKAVAVLDDAWIVFTETRAYAIFGEGPDDSGVGSFSEPREIPSAVGCIDWRSVVAVPAGLLFQGRADAIYLLPRGLGAPVEISRPVIDVLRLPGARITAARLVTAQGVVMFALTSGEEVRHLVQDLRTGQWVVDLPYGGTGNPLAGFAEWDTLLAWCTDSEIRQERPEYTDDDLPYDLIIETHPLRPGGLQRSVRCRRVEAIGEYRGDADLMIEAAPDDAQSFNYDATWTITGLVSGDAWRREWRLPVQKFGSVRVRLAAHSTGPGIALTGLTLESEIRPGTPKLGIGHRA